MQSKIGYSKRMFASNFGTGHQKHPWDAWGPFPRSVWIHPNTPKDDLDIICFKIWTRIQSPGQDLGSGSPQNTNKPADIIVNSETAPLNKITCDSENSIKGTPDVTKITILGRHEVQLHSEIKQMVQQEFQSLSKEHNIQPRGTEVRKDLSRREEDPHNSKQDGPSTEERQQRSAEKLLKGVQAPKGKTVPWLPAIEEFPALPHPAQPWSGRVSQSPAAAWPSLPTSSSTQSVAEIQDFLKKVLLTPSQEQVPQNQEGFPQNQPVSKGTAQTEMPQLLLMLNEKSDVPETDTRRCQTHTAGTNHDLNADGLRVDFHSFGTAEDRAKRPAGPCDEVKRHPCLERATRPETMMPDPHPKPNAGALKNIPPQGSAELGSHVRSARNTALPVPHAVRVTTAEHCQTHPVRPPPGFQPLQHLFPQLFPPQQMTLLPGINPLQIPAVPPVNQMNVVRDVMPPPFILFLPPGQLAPPFLLPANMMDPSCLPGAGPLWPFTPVCRDNFQDSMSPNDVVRGFAKTPLIYMRSQGWMQPP